MSLTCNAPNEESVAWRDLWVDKTRVLLVVLSIAVGVFAVGMIASLQMIIVNDHDQGAETNPAHAAFYGRFDEQTVESVRRMDGVLDAQGRGFLSAQLSFKEAWRRIQFSTILDYDEIRIKQITSVSGALTPSKGEFLIEQASLDA